MANDPYRNMDDDQFFYARLHHYYDGSLPVEAASRFHSMLEREEYKAKAELYLKEKLRLHSELAGIQLSKKRLSDVRNLVQGASVMTEEEQREIEEFSENSKMIVVMRLLAVILLFAGAIGYGIWKLKPGGKDKFEPLYYLSYESMALQEDPSGRMDLLTSDMSDVET